MAECGRCFDVLLGELWVVFPDFMSRSEVGSRLRRSGCGEGDLERIVSCAANAGLVSFRLADESAKDWTYCRITGTGMQKYGYWVRDRRRISDSERHGVAV